MILPCAVKIEIYTSLTFIIFFKSELRIKELDVTGCRSPCYWALFCVWFELVACRPQVLEYVH